MSSPRFWQKLGLGKQNKSSSSNTKSDKQDSGSIQSSISFRNLHEATTLNNNNNEKQVKRFSSNMSLSHRASSASLRQQITQTSNLPEKQMKRTSYMKPLRKIDPEEYNASSSYNRLIENDVNSNYDTTTPGSIKRDRNSSTLRNSNDLQFQRKASTATLPQLQQHQIPTKKHSIADININKNVSAIPITNSRLPPTIGHNMGRSSFDQQQKPASCGSRLRQPSPAISHAKVLSRSGSNNSLSSSSMPKKKSLPKLNPSHSGEDDNSDSRSSLTRSSSNGSNSTATNDKNGKRRSSLEKRKSRQQMMGDQTLAGGGNFIIDMLKGELEKEKASSRSLLGQKEAIAKDLDYFCNLVDEVTEEKDNMKRKYEQEKLENEELKKSIEQLQIQYHHHSELKGASSKGAEHPSTSPLKLELEAMQQLATEEQYAYFNNLQYKNEEISKLKQDLKQAQKQIKILRKTMKQILKAEGKDNYDDNDFSSVDDSTRSRKSSAIFENDNNNGEKYLLLQAGYHPDNLSINSGTSNNNASKPSTNPPSPMPGHSSIGNDHGNDITSNIANSSNYDDEDEDILSTTSRESYHSNHNSQMYDFLKYDSVDDHISSLAKRKSAEFSKKLAMSRRRKDQLEEMLGEVDSQLNKVKQKIRPC